MSRQVYLLTWAAPQEITEWLKENMQGIWSKHADATSNIGWYQIENPDDYVLFKLRWGDHFIHEKEVP